MIGFNKLYKAGRITRYHTADVKPQTLGHHQWGVAMIVCMIYPNHRPPPDIIMAALTHDLAESETGDIPATAKWGNSRLDAALSESEVAFNKRHGIDFELTMTGREQDILHWADTFELCLYCQYQVNMGNEYAGEILANGIGHLRKMRFPTTEAKELYDSIFGDYPSSAIGL
jgi:5'-deoxynucleotidase YfbR-like HD superfamily hydrolase